MSETNHEQEPQDGNEPEEQQEDGGDNGVDAPEPVEPEAVTVEPEAAPTEAPGLLDQFEVTPERGYRRKES